MIIRLCRGLPEHLGQAHDGNRARADDVGQDLPGSDGGELVDVADDEQRRVVRRRLHQRLHQHNVDHRGLVDHEQVAIEGIFDLRLNPPLLGSTSRSRWMVFASSPSLRSCASPRGPSGRKATVCTPLAARI